MMIMMTTTTRNDLGDKPNHSITKETKTPSPIIKKKKKGIEVNQTTRI